jgi:hypothetical protein
VSRSVYLNDRLLTEAEHEALLYAWNQGGETAFVRAANEIIRHQVERDMRA